MNDFIYIYTLVYLQPVSRKHELIQLNINVIINVFAGRAPFFIEKPLKCTILQGGTTIFRCRVDGDPAPTVDWSKGKWKKMENDSITRVFYDDHTDQYVLEMDDTKVGCDWDEIALSVLYFKIAAKRSLHRNEIELSVPRDLFSKCLCGRSNFRLYWKGLDICPLTCLFMSFMVMSYNGPRSWPVGMS